MFSSRRSVFAAPADKNAGPFGVALGLLAAAIIIFALGIYTGRTYPSFLAFTSPAPVAPVTATEF
jgi:hypothetical protein